MLRAYTMKTAKAFTIALQDIAQQINHNQETKTIETKKNTKDISLSHTRQWTAGDVEKVLWTVATRAALKC